MRTVLIRGLLLWALLLGLGCVLVAVHFHIRRAPLPEAAARSWSLALLEAVRAGQPWPDPPAALEGVVPVAAPVVELWWRGRPFRAERGSGTFVAALRSVARRLAADPALHAHPGFGAEADPPVRFTVTVPLGEGPLLRGVPFLSELGLVPLREGLFVRLGEREAVLTPHAIWASGRLDQAVSTPITDLTFGVDTERLLSELAAELHVPLAEITAQGQLGRFAAVTLSEETYPRKPTDPSAQVTRDNLRSAAREGAAFLLRHQRADGRYTYLFDAQRNRRRGDRGYNLARHAGTTFFLAQAAAALDMDDARRGALRALRFVRKRALLRCGAPDRLCVGQGTRVRLGATALTALAAAQVLQGGDIPTIRRLLVGLTAHLRAMQREDGELMHEFDVRKGRPIDIQRMFYSGEAALALLKAHEVLGDPRDLATVKRLMAHLTGKGWNFFGSRYFYGEEHWTCQAVGAADGLVDLPGALSFCRRWTEFQGEVQYRAGQTPWNSAGAYGVGPILLPRITAVAARVEAGVPIYRRLRARGQDATELAGQLRTALSALLRYRFCPGPVHLFAEPGAARGGFPATQASLFVRNDFVQHAGSAMLAWADVLAEQAP